MRAPQPRRGSEGCVSEAAARAAGGAAAATSSAADETEECAGDAVGARTESAAPMLSFGVAPPCNALASDVAAPRGAALGRRRATHFERACDRRARRVD